MQNAAEYNLDAARKFKLKANYVGIAGCILALISILFPLWSSMVSGFVLGAMSTQYYLVMVSYNISADIPDIGWQTNAPELWQIVPLALLIAGGVIGLLGNLKKKNTILFRGQYVLPYLLKYLRL